MTRTIRTPLVMGNWKMHLTAAEAVRFLHELRGKLDSQAGVETAVAPSFLSIPAARDALHGSPIRLGAQNMHWDAAGARTGEVSPAMLKAEGVSMVILGLRAGLGDRHRTDADPGRDPGGPQPDPPEPGRSL